MSSAQARHRRLSNNPDCEPTNPRASERPPKWHQRFSKLFARDDASDLSTRPSQQAAAPRASSAAADTRLSGHAAGPEGTPIPAPSRLARQVIPGLPRPATFRRQMSERRERLAPSNIPHSERRTLSVDRRRAFSTRPPSPVQFVDARISAPTVYDFSHDQTAIPTDEMPTNHPHDLPQQANMNAMLLQRPTNPPTPPPDVLSHVPEDSSQRGSAAIDIQAELESKWILNLSMHFRDKSPREKFFVTYAETPTRWRRVTISCDYRNAPADSLEADLQALHYQRDKSTRIYEAIRTSLPDIQFYDTVTNLRLETSADDRLHVHVTEDVNEIIPYPDKHILSHLGSEMIPRIREEKVHFLSHMSGFVYKVRVGNEVLIKKEIPGPDSVEEFLYEINALSALIGSDNVVQIRGLVVDDELNTMTGLLIDYYEQGPLVDILFDYRGELSWERRGKWAKQIVRGLAEIHEAGFVQGDFTVSNICVGADDNARIIDINRRGCPVGWEPPEIAAMIESGQRISMYIGVKSDVFQLGMVLWAIANEDDEPERRERPLRLESDQDANRHGTDPAPSWYRHITHLCLEPQPAKRPSANKLLDSALVTRDLRPVASNENPLADTTTHTWASASTAVPNLSLSRHNDRKQQSTSPFSQTDEMPRGRSPPRNTAHLGPDWHWNRYPRRHSRQRSLTQERNLDAGSEVHADEAEVEPEIVPIDPTGEGWREITVNGRSYITQDGGFDDATDTDDGSEHLDIAFGEDAFGRHSLLCPVPPAPDVPQAPDPPFNVMPHGFHHVDSGLGDMNVSDNLLGHYRQYVSANHASDHEANYPISDHEYHFRHHDSGLADMDFEQEFELIQNRGSSDQHAHRSGRRTESWNHPASALGASHAEEHALADVSEEASEWQDAGQSNKREEAAVSARTIDEESEHGDHPGGVSLQKEVISSSESNSQRAVPLNPPRVAKGGSAEIETSETSARTK